MELKKGIEMSIFYALLEDQFLVLVSTISVV